MIFELMNNNKILDIDFQNVNVFYYVLIDYKIIHNSSIQYHQMSKKRLVLLFTYATPS